ncbi:MAG TPA: hypothetical protein V6D17_24895 [Candidatus Obscuribacterales bacterium]
MRVRNSKQRILGTQQRAASAFSLVTVMIVGALGTMWLAGAYASLIPIANKSTSSRQIALLRTVSEAAIDHVMTEINTSIANKTPSVYDDVDVGPPYNKFELAPNKLNIENSENSRVGLEVVVKNIAPRDDATSATILFDPQLAPNSMSEKRMWSAVAKNGWRSIEVHAFFKGGSQASDIKRVYRVTLCPTTDAPTGGNGPTFFGHFAVLSNSKLTVNSDTEIADGDIGTNGSKTSLGAPVSIEGSGIKIENGDLVVKSLGDAADVVAQSTETADAKVDNGYLRANGSVDGFQDKSNGQSYGDPTTTKVEKNGVPEAILQGQSEAQQLVAPVPKAPSGAYDLGTINVSGTATLVFTGSSFDIPAGQSLSNLTSGVARVPAGAYQISSLSVSDQGRVAYIPANGADPPVQLFIDNPSPGSSAVDLGGFGVVNASSKAGNFQVWYNGKQDVNITSKPINPTIPSKLTIYAPNAAVKIKGQNSSAAGRVFMQGAIVGKSVSTHNAKVRFEEPEVSQGSSSGKLSWVQEGGYAKIARLVPVLWQELNYNDFVAQTGETFPK